MTDSDFGAFDSQVDGVRHSGVLGRSYGLARLFEVLVAAHRQDRALREADLAQEVFGQAAPGDASVRVYIHRLRRKLIAFYAGLGVAEPHRLSIPLGQYRLDLAAAGVAVVPAPRSIGQKVVAAACVLLAANLAAWAWFAKAEIGADASVRRALRSPVWSMIDGKRPVTLVVGDYYIFGEARGLDVERMIREFDVNSAADLQRKLMQRPELQDRYIDLDTSYTATGSTIALQYILPLARAAARDPRRLKIVMSSELTPEMLKADDIIYVGDLSALRVLEQPVFANSRLKIGETYDELLDRKTGRAFDSSAGTAARREANLDYGYLRTLEGPGGAHIVIIAGTRDIGVLQMAETAANPAYPADPGATRHDLEALYEVRGIGRTNISARRIALADAR